MRPHFEQVCEWIGLTLTPTQWRACRFLETCGFRFCVDFGYQNAVTVAQAHWRQMKRGKPYRWHR